MVEKNKKQKQKRHNIIIDGKGKAKGLNDFQTGTLDATYHLIEELAVSAHALTIFREFLASFSKKERDQVTRLCNKVIDMMEGQEMKVSFATMQIMYVNTYARLFDTGISSMFNQIKLQREGIMFNMQQKLDLEKRVSEKQPDKQPSKTHEGAEIA